MNNKALSVVNVLLIVAVIILFIMQLNNSEPTVENNEMSDDPVPEVNIKDEVLTKPDSAMSKLPEFNRGLKIAFVNSDSLNKNYRYYEDAKNEISQELAKVQGRIEGKKNALMKKYAALEQKAQGGQMWNDEIQAEAAKLQEQEMRLGQEAQELQAKLSNVEYEVTLKVINETADYLDEIGKELGYDYVLTYAKSNQIIVFANENFDITDYVTKKLNEAYASKKN
ncbi:OmpH family outer membrane protein [Flavobacteriales bacterium]|nr:OmpH family outer membrane protein [Flavobacteriales bacterium]